MSNPGDMRDWVLIQYSTFDQKTTGEKVEAWHDQEWDWMDVQPQGSQIQWKARQIQPETTHLIVMRFRPLSETRHRLVFEGKVYVIMGIVDEKNMNRYLRVEAKETEELIGSFIEVSDGDPLGANVLEPITYG